LHTHYIQFDDLKSFKQQDAVLIQSLEREKINFLLLDNFNSHWQLYQAVYTQ